MKLFSERYGYTQPSDVIIRERITPEIQNAICSCYDNMRYSKNWYTDLELYLWKYFLNNREDDFHKTIAPPVVATKFIEDSHNPWYKKLDLIEFTITYLIKEGYGVIGTFIEQLNSEFERLHFAYRIVEWQIVEISSETEISTIEEAMENSSDNIRFHLNKSLELYAQRPNGDYGNSIKESISAVEAFCRAKTGKDTLGKALDELANKGIIIPQMLKTAFEKLYAYTNQPDTGIRHALMDESGTFTPASEEALFMLVSCSAFINYLNKKVRE